MKPGSIAIVGMGLTQQGRALGSFEVAGQIRSRFLSPSSVDGKSSTESRLVQRAQHILTRMQARGSTAPWPT
jgi:hypothetical protein